MSYIPKSGAGYAGVISKSAAYAVGAGDQFIEVTCSGANIAITLPAATASGRVVAVKKVDATAFLVNVTPAGTDTIDGAAAAFGIGTQWQSVSAIDVASGKWEIF